jgi:hypothetical protein
MAYLHNVTGVVLACACIIGAGCTAGVVDDQGDDVEQVADEGVGEAEQAIWRCEGWYGPSFQHCLTKCGNGSYWHSVGSESVIANGQCTAEAAHYCSYRGWGPAHNVCWGSNW